MSNSAINGGGGVFDNSTNGVVSIVDSNFIGNGAVYNVGVNNSLFAIGSSFVRNNAIYGAEIFDSSSMCVSNIKGNIFTGNIGDYGDAIYNNADIMLLVGNFMSNNEANIVGNESW